MQGSLKKDIFEVLEICLIKNLHFDLNTKLNCLHVFYGNSEFFYVYYGGIAEPKIKTSKRRLGTLKELVQKLKML